MLQVLQVQGLQGLQGLQHLGQLPEPWQLLAQPEQQLQEPQQQPGELLLLLQVLDLAQVVLRTPGNGPDHCV